ncbi:hypothetical protein M407DRAFT_5732 [Tulasnella calospora MUT 4182]|uniref:Uncharacterized protein n=1 Tax=Tulasnella calospora MUT 4182 TaxID=1051891 RepID=A0A0C3L8P3_9AGAM|nr:hypothetical protein M407DRAFT_5732 [Tulasnella calospora MUT 4182]
MATPAAFSRLQLAAALLEYDNDPDNPDAPQVNAKESAIFVNLRRPAPPPRVLQQHQDDGDDEDVPLSHTVQTRTADNRKSMVASLINVEQEDPERDAEDEMLSSWGLEGLVEKNEKKDKRPTHLNFDKFTTIDLDEPREPPSRALSAMLPNPHGPPTPTDVNTSSIQRYPPKRPLSMGDMDGLVIGVSPERRRKSPEVIDYRRSMIGTLDFTSPAPKSPGEGDGPQDLLAFPSKNTLKSTPAKESPNPFAIPLPESMRRSRLDPKAISDERRLSIGSMGQLADQANQEDQVDLEDPPEDSSTNFFGTNHPDSRLRTHSMGTIPTQAMLDADEPSPLPSPAAPESKRLTRLDLLRPKVLVMPSPLQDQKAGPSKKTRDGFFTTDDGGLPLPIGSRPEARPGLAPLPGSGSNPRLSMSLSQLTFRQSLMVGGQRDPSYADIDRNLRMADQDGERADQGWSEEEDEDKELRPAGKLYGKSLIDNLEARKAVIKGKQRVFTGDQRPAMMQRQGVTRSSTLIDPSTFNSRPTTQYLTPSQVQEDVRRKRASGAPLVDFSSEAPPGPNARPGVPPTRSVFGVDKVWERELAKMKALEEQEKEEQAKLQALDARLEDRRHQAGLPRNTSANVGPRASTLLPDPEHISPLMPTPPLGEANSDDARRPPLGSRRESAASLGARGWFNSPGSDDESDGGDKRASFASTATARPPPFPRKISAPSRLPQIPGGADDSEEEDVPLAQQAARRSMMPPGQNSKPSALADSDSDEDKPIAVLKRHQSKSSAGPSGSFAAELGLGSSAFSPKKRAPAGKADDSSSEDEVPLGVRHPTANRLSTMPSGLQGDDEDEDDKPLGAKFAGASMNPLQQQQMQQQAFLQQQMLQQQMMMQAQMRTSMAFGGPMMNPSVMGSGFFPPPMSMHSLNANAMTAAQDAQSAQISRVDQWRRDVVQ